MDTQRATTEQQTHSHTGHRSFRQRMREFIADYGPSIAITVAGLALSLLLYLKFVGSPLQESPEAWQAKVQFHLDRPAFAIRPFQTQATLLLHRLTSWPLRESFFLIQFALALALGPLFFRYLRKLGFERAPAHAGLVLLMTAYPILGAHFEPTFTWDDIWAYLFVVLALTDTVQRRFISAALWLTLGCFAREQSLFFYPILALSAFWARQLVPRRQLLTAALLPLIAYIPYRVMVSSGADVDRWALLNFNFATPGRSADTIVSLIIAFGVIWLLAIPGYRAIVRDRLWPNRKLIMVGAAITVPVTVLVTLTATLARETRIFFPPFVFLIPLAIVGYTRLAQRWANVSKVRLKRALMTALPVLVPLGFLIVNLFLSAFEYGTNHVFRRQMAGLHIGLSLAVLLLWITVVVIDRRRTSAAGKLPGADSLAG